MTLLKHMIGFFMQGWTHLPLTKIPAKLGLVGESFSVYADQDYIWWDMFPGGGLGGLVVASPSAVRTAVGGMAGSPSLVH